MVDTEDAAYAADAENVAAVAAIAIEEGLEKEGEERSVSAEDTTRDGDSGCASSCAGAGACAATCDRCHARGRLLATGGAIWGAAGAMPPVGALSAASAVVAAMCACVFKPVSLTVVVVVVVVASALLPPLGKPFPTLRIAASAIHQKITCMNIIGDLD